MLQKDEKQMPCVSSEDIAAATAHLPSINEERQQLEHAVSIDVRNLSPVIPLIDSTKLAYSHTVHERNLTKLFCAV
jgi:hypothetical protein